MNPFALFILKEANGFLTLHYINFLTPKSSRPDGTRWVDEGMKFGSFFGEIDKRIY